MAELEGWIKEEYNKTVTSPYYQPTLMTYIRNKKNQRVGMIQAFKITPEYLNEYYDYEKIDKPFVIIVHAKANTNIDKYDAGKSDEILDSRLEYCLAHLSDKVKRQKRKAQTPTSDILDHYINMGLRSERYFKDCDKIIRYIHMFEYTKPELETEEDLIKEIHKLVPDLPWNTYATYTKTDLQIPESVREMLKTD